jgi:hypothetical protein
MIPDKNNRDWVSVVSFDTLTGGGPVIEQPVTGDYKSAMQSCTRLQAVGDKGTSTATEAGMATARDHIKAKNLGGKGRNGTSKVVVLLTDGVPNAWITPGGDLDQFANTNPSPDFYGAGYHWYNGPLMQANLMEADGWMVFPVGTGLGTDYDFMDRLARMGATADDNGESPRGTGNPAEYEQRMTDIFTEIINSPQVRLVE